MRTLVECTKASPVGDEDIAHLARRLAESGNLLTLPPSRRASDVASTGGPSSLSTLLCPLYLRVFGCWVPKLAVPGRPAGGIDVMAQIPGFRVRLTQEEIYGSLEKCGYAHFLAGEMYAPLDVDLFSYRQRAGAQAIPELVIASLLAKKVAVGLSRAGLDVRVAPHGNFGATWEEAREHARRFCRVARLLGIETVCFLTDARTPYQPYIGRGESLLAMDDLFDDRACDSLALHAELCFKMAQAAALEEKATRPTSAELKVHFARNLEAQGTDYTAFKLQAEIIRAEKRFNIFSPAEGYLFLDLEELRSILVEIQARFAGEGNIFPDPCGVILLKMPGVFVRKGEVVASARFPEEIMMETCKRLGEHFTVSEDAPRIKRMEIVANG